ncbi:MAG: hypothetical protein ACOZNI_02685, partial [Myxococcota bacterium]
KARSTGAAAVAVEAVAPAPTPAAGPRLRAAKFTITGAEGIAVDCGGVKSSGATSAVVRDFPAGTCAVTAGALATKITVDSPRGVACAVEGGTLTCR